MGGLLAGIGALFYALALWTGTVLGGLSWRVDPVAGVVGPYLDVGQG